MLWFGDSGQILPASTDITWGYTWNIPGARWAYAGGDPATITPDASEISAIGYFNVCKLNGTYTADAFYVNRNPVSLYPGFGVWGALGGGISVGDICALEESSGVLISSPVLLTNLGAGAYQDPSYVYWPPQGLTGITFGIINTTAPWQGDDFLNRRKITVKKEVVHGSPVNIPVKVDFDASEEAMIYALENYKKGAMIQVFTSDDVEIPCEAGVRYNPTTGEKSARLFFLAPSLSSKEDNEFYFYYGSKAEKAATFTDKQVWPKGYDGVWHYGWEIVGAFADARGY